MAKKIVHERCEWVQLGNKLSEEYHDLEWGVPVHDDYKHFEFLILEGAQAGLSWQTILNRREGYRKAFASFDPQKVARFNEAKIEQLLLDKSIIRNRLKIESAINNAKKFIEIQEKYESFDKYIWNFVNGKTIQNHWKSIQDIPVESKESIAISNDLKNKGFNFVGPTIIYAYMQAVGLINDHTINCFKYNKLI